MRGRAFLALARDLAAGRTEAYWRGAAIHAYYALFLECRDALTRWHQPTPPRQSVHPYVRLRFTRAGDPDLKAIGDALDILVRQRNTASYDLNPVPAFASPAMARALAQQAAVALALLDAIDADPAHRAAAIASLPPP
jgi:hypothetical protein